MIKVYNTMTRRKEEFVTIEPNAVKMYVCGSTVYGLIHVGNARPVVIFDAIRRYLEYKGYKVNFVSNYTDVDDKIIKKANDEGVASAVIAERYIAEARKDCAALNALPATANPKATEEMSGIINIVETLIEKGFAYASDDGSVFFDVSKDGDYGKLSGKRVDDLEAGIRVAVDEKKRNPSDFVLWKPAKENEPGWTSPWGTGRPGWHIECSAMVKSYLGDTIDIHGGGEDLIFPHHENEIAQSECANGAALARYWLHAGMVMTDNEKMSKSLGNFFVLRDAGERFGYDTARFFILSAHYRSPINFSAELLESARNALTRIYNCMDKLADMNGGEQRPVGLESFRNAFEEAMNDDFNTANAVSAIFELVKFANVEMNKDNASALLRELKGLCGVLGIEKPENVELRDGTEELLAALLEKRVAAKKAKDFALADEIRSEIGALGYDVVDTREGSKCVPKR